LPYRDEAHAKEIVSRMLEHGFIEQELRYAE